MIGRTKRKLAAWRCYRNGHQYTFAQRQEASVKLWNGEDGTIKCQRCATETDIEESSDPALAITRMNRNLFRHD